MRSYNDLNVIKTDNWWNQDKNKALSSAALADLEFLKVVDNRMSEYYVPSAICRT